MQNRFAFGKRSPSRRQFLSGCSALTLAATAAPTMVFALPFPGANGTLDTIGFGHFSSQLGTAFRVWPNPKQVVDMVLVEARQQAANQPEALWAPDAQNEKFSLIFQGPASFRLDQDTYLFEHPGLGRFPMFIVPVFTRSSEEAYYEAIFNRPFIQRNRRNLRAW